MVKQILMLISLFCVFATGCQDNVSVNPVNKIKHETAGIKQNSEANKTADTAAPLDENSQTVIAYYFHRTIRCPGCLEIEAAAQRVIETRFENQIANEKLMWIPLNLDEPGGEEFEKEFDVSVSTLVIAKMQDGNHTKYKKLEKVWDLIGDPVKFDEYVQTEVEEFLNE